MSYPGATTFPDHGSGVRAAGRSPLTLQASARSVLAMTASPVSPGALGMGVVGSAHGSYPGHTVFPGIYPGQGTDLTFGHPQPTTLVVTPV